MSIELKLVGENGSDVRQQILDLLGGNSYDNGGDCDDPYCPEEHPGDGEPSYNDMIEVMTLVRQAYLDAEANPDFGEPDQYVLNAVMWFLKDKGIMFSWFNYGPDGYEEGSEPCEGGEPISEDPPAP